MATNSSAIVVNTTLISGASEVAERSLRGGLTGEVNSVMVSTAMAEPPPVPRLDEVDDQKHREGDRQHERGNGGRAGVIELLQPDDDEERGDLRNVGDVSGDEDYRAILADRTGERERIARQDRGHQAREKDAG